MSTIRPPIFPTQQQPAQGAGAAKGSAQRAFFEAAFGFAGCLLLLLAAKVVGHLFLQKREDYYDE